MSTFRKWLYLIRPLRSTLMTKFLKPFFFIFLSLLVLLVVSYYWGLEYWANHNLEKIINQNEDRNYQLTYQSLEIHEFEGITLYDVALSKYKSDKVTGVEGTVQSIELMGVEWWSLIVQNKLSLGSMSFNRPAFDIVFSETNTKENQSTTRADIIQQLFTDIISRGELSDFSLIDGKVNFRQRADQDTLVAGSIQSISFQASGIVTDSVIFKYPIPFLMSKFSASMKGLEMTVDAYRNLYVEQLNFDSEQETLSATGSKLRLTKPWIEISRELEQTDLIEFELDSLGISQLDALSDLFGEDLDIRAGSALVNGLNIQISRNYNRPRPADQKKPMFEGLLNKIKFPLFIDTFMVQRSAIHYTQLMENKPDAGTLTFNNLYGSFYHITTIDHLKKEKKIIEADLISEINGSGNLKARLVVPYFNDEFSFMAELTNLDLSQMNSTLEPLGDMTSSGIIKKLKFDMAANTNEARSELDIQYDNLKVVVLDAQEDRKKLFSTFLANTAVRNQNLPGTNGYRIYAYTTKRDPNRSPFNYLWTSLYEGGTAIMFSKPFRNSLSKNGNVPKELTDIAPR